MTQPFVSVLENFKNVGSIPFNKIAQIVREEFKAFKPHCFHMNFPEGIVMTVDYKIDLYTFMGNIKDVVNLSLAKNCDKVELMPLKKMRFYENYVSEYEVL